ALEPPRHVVITGKPGTRDFDALVEVVHERLGPRRTLMALDSSKGARTEFAANSPWLGAMGENDTRATAYVCEEFVCRAPARTPEELRRALASAAPMAPS
ncbi:MAG TPA: hypothetical protein VIJ19_08655, partial [Opitutaceae bacterium]